MRLLHEGHGPHARVRSYLVVPLPDEGTAMRVRDTTGSPEGSRAVSQLSNRPGNVDSTTGRCTPAIRTTPGTRTSATATRTGTTGATTTARSPSANKNDAVLSFEQLVEGHFDCRKRKRNTEAAARFELNLAPNLCSLYHDLLDGTYEPGCSICFVDTDHGKPREIWAAPYRDRVVHHAFYNEIAPRFERSFIADSCACLKGRGTLYAAQRLESHVRSITRNWQRQAYYLQCDIWNFFVSINKPILHEILCGQITEPWWRELAATIIFHDPRTNAEIQSPPEKLALIPEHKSLFNQPADQGLPIGNLWSQFGANVALDVVDQHIKHRIRAPYYIRYVDDFILLHESAQWLNEAKAEIEEVLAVALRLKLNPSKTILQPISRGIDFAGHLIEPHRRRIRRRTFHRLMHRLSGMEGEAFHQAANSYFGLLRQATHSHGDRAQLANLARRRGFAVNRQLTQTYRGPI